MNVPNTTALPSPARVTPNQLHAFGGVWRLTFRRFLLPGHWLMLGIALAVLALLCFSLGQGRKGNGDYVGWIVGFYVTFLVPAFAFMAAGGAIRDEMKSGTVDYVLTRPVRRPAFLVFKYLAHTLCTQLDFLFAFGVVLAIGVLRDVPGLAEAAPKLLLGQVLLVAAFSAFGFLGGVLTSRYVIVGLAYGGLIEVGVGQIPTQLSRLSMTHQVRDLLGSLAGSDTLAPTALSALGTSGIVLLFGATMLALAAVIFTVRELSGPADA